MRGVWLAGAIAIAALAVQASAEGSLAARLAAAAAALVASFDETQRDRAVYAFDDDERFDLRLAPFLLDGVRVDELRAGQEDQLWALLDAGLSDSGAAKLRAIMSLEAEVERSQREGGLLGRLGLFLIDRDPKAYHLTIYGDPGSGGPWGYRFDGHHVSLNYTIAPGRTPAAAPMFLGAQPRRVRDGWERAGLQVLADEENAARALYASLEGDARRRATLPYAADRDLFIAAEARPDFGGPRVGLPRSAMSEAEQKALDRTISAYLDTLAPEIANARRASIDAGAGQIHFAWAGSATPGEPHYYRIHGPAILLEFDNTSAGADHIHVVWHDPQTDYGLDLLREHHARYHPEVPESPHPFQ